VENGPRHATEKGANPLEEMMRSYQRPTRGSTRRTGANPCLLAVSAVATILFSYAVAAQQQPLGVPREDARFAALGSGSCRPCHRGLYESWADSTHALAAEKLTSQQKFDPACVRCHVPDSAAFEDGVGCEACHGPGSAYADLDVMIDPLKSVAAGLQEPGATCVYCHNAGHDFHVERDFPAAARRVHSPGGAIPNAYRCFSYHDSICC